MNNRCADRRGTVQLESLRSEDNEKIWKERKMEETRNEVMQEVAEVQQDSYKSGSVQYIDSREVAEIVEKEHKNLIRDIKRYDKELVQLNFEPNEFFIESSYNDSIGRTLPCYLVTRKGCEFIAHKLTGIKGTKFTATYINRFHEMEDALESRRIEEMEKMENQIFSVCQQFIPALYQFMERQTELTTKILERLDKEEDGRGERQVERQECRSQYHESIYCSGEKSVIEKRKKELYEMTADVAGLCGVSHSSVLHQMYCMLEENLNIVLDSYRNVYRMETGKPKASMVEVIASNDWIYEEAVRMNEIALEKKQIFN